MTPLPLGNTAAHDAFLSAMASGSLHHAWLLAGPALPPRFDVPDSHPTSRLLESGAHPDFRVLQRQPKDDKAKSGEGELARSIPIAQVRSLNPMFAMVPSQSSRRVILIDSIDEVERPGASNALLKNLEEPPQGTIFLLVSHAPGRLLPTIRSRCRLLRFEALDDATMARVLRAQYPAADDAEIAALMVAGQGSPGRAAGFAGLDMAALDTALAAIAADGDPSNARRARLAKLLSPKAAQPRYEAFLDRAPAFIAAAAPGRGGAALRTALDSYDAARALSASARALSLDAQGTVFEMAGLVARLAAR